MTKSHTTIALLLTLSAAGALLGGNAAAQSNSSHGKTDRFLAAQLRSPSERGWTNVIARVEGDLTTQQQAQLSCIDARITRHLPIIHSAALSVPSRNLDKLAALPFIQRLSSDLSVKKTDEFTVEASGAAAAFPQYQLTGSNVRVAIIDSGIHSQPDFGNQAIAGLPKPTGGGSRLVAQINFVPDDKGKVNSGDCDDKCGHGTHVAGIAAGNGANSLKDNCYRHFFGIAPQADLVTVRVLDANGQGTVSQVIAGLQWVIANKAKYSIRIANLSLGHPVGESYTTDPLCQAVESAWKAGIVVVCSAGNSGRLQDTAVPSVDNEGYGSAYGSIQSPGNDPYVITVGAMKAMDAAVSAAGVYTHNRNNDRVATYSSRGPSRLDLVLKPDLVAPGNKIVSVDADNSYLDTTSGNTNNIRRSEYMTKSDTNWSNAYFRLSGTSMAAPVVAGAAALLLQKDPTLTPDTLKARLMLSADKWTQPNGTTDPCTFGAGYLNIPAALANTAVAGQAATSPTLSIDANGNVNINMDRALWGHDITGASAVWGIYGVSDLRAIWGHNTLADSFSGLLTDSRAIWGHSLSAERALWGHTVWEDRAI